MRGGSPVFAAGFLAALLVSAGCPLGDWWYPTTAYRCDPAGEDPRCPAAGNDYQCCSDDPAALDTAAPDTAALPSFAESGGTGVPLFALERNASGRHGMCVREGSIPPAQALANGCPKPCNPTWDQADIESVCGEDMYCCQTVEIEAADCVFDPTLGNEGCHRPVRGEDIEGLGGLELSGWAPGSHETHQDPGGSACQAFVEGLGDAQLEGSSRDAVLAGCYRRLGAADQRGFCLGGTAIKGCPLAQPEYRDACERLNDEQGLAGC